MRSNAQNEAEAKKDATEERESTLGNLILKIPLKL